MLSGSTIFIGQIHADYAGYIVFLGEGNMCGPLASVLIV
jgi:hypothetical protein